MNNQPEKTYREQLLLSIEEFESDLPALIKANPQDGQFRAALTLVVDWKVSEADPGEREWMRGCLNLILHSYRIRSVDPDAIAPR